MEVVPNNRYWRQLALIWRLAWPVIRQVLGWMFILLGLLGLVLPVLQGVLFLVIGVALVGRRNWLIRRTSFGIKRGLRRWAAHPSPFVGRPGRLALRAQHQYSRQSRRLHRSLADRFQPRAPLAEPPCEPPYEQA
jgi:hypothetical protein